MKDGEMHNDKAITSLIVVHVSDNWDEERGVGLTYGPFETWKDAEEWVSDLRDGVRWSISRVMPPHTALTYRVNE